jgi:hypothetical protein
MKLLGFILFLGLSFNVLSASALATSQTSTNTAAALPSSGYYTFRQDLRKCASPFCGGIFVKSVNLRYTRCADGKLRNECYIAFTNNPRHFKLGNAALLKGKISQKSFLGLGNFGVFTVQSAFRNASAKPVQGQFFSINSNGRVCITSPCFSWNQRLLNTAKSQSLSGLDLSTAGASSVLTETAYNLLANGGFLLAAGRNMQTEELAGPGITFKASQFFIPLKPGVK